MSARETITKLKLRNQLLTERVRLLRVLVDRQRHHDWGPEVERWRSLVDYYMRKYGGSFYQPERDLDVMMGIMACASGGDPWRITGKEWVGEPPPGYDPNDDATKASGLFEQIPAYWESRSRMAGFEGRDIFDPEANIAVACWLLWVDWGREGAPHWHHWGGAHVGEVGSYEWALQELGMEPPV